MSVRLPPAAAAFLFASALAAPAAVAGSLSGKLEPPPDPGDRPTLPRGYLARIANPLAPVPPYDPVPYLVVVAVPAASDAAAAKPATVVWDLRGDSFARPVIAARLGDAIEIRNSGRAAPVLVARGEPQLLPKKPLNPTDRVQFTPTKAGLVDVVDESTPHLRGRLLVIDRGAYAVPDASGKFEFPDLAPGDWTIRVYYAPRDVARGNAAPATAGWIQRPDDKVTIGAKKTELTIKLPAALPVTK